MRRPYSQPSIQFDLPLSRSRFRIVAANSASHYSIRLLRSLALFSFPTQTSALAMANLNKDSAGQKVEDTKQFGQQKAGEAHQATKDAAGTAGDKTNQAGGAAGQKWEQTKQASSDATKTASDKAGEARDGAAGMFQQAGTTIGNTFQNAKEAVLPKK